jgi:hypothetical protein
MADIGFSREEYQLAENVARFSELIHTHPQHKALYDRYADLLGGFPGFYDMSIYTAKALRDLEQEIDWGERVPTFDDWYSATGRVVDLIYKLALEGDEKMPITNPDWLKKIVKGILGKAKDWSPRE